MFKELGVSLADAQKRIIVLTNDLSWAGGPSASLSTPARGLLQLGDLLKLGTLPEEEKFNNHLANETVYLCYSSGTTGKPKGVEVSGVDKLSVASSDAEQDQSTHRNLTSVLDQVKPGFFRMDPKVDRVLGILPFYHIYGA
jgi:4-coumarate--CoA ligase